jgi:hypothetical protein
LYSENGLGADRSEHRVCHERAAHGEKAPQKQKLSSSIGSDDQLGRLAADGQAQIRNGFRGLPIPPKLAVLRDATRERGGPDEFAITSTELIRKHPIPLLGCLRTSRADRRVVLTVPGLATNDCYAEGWGASGQLQARAALDAQDERRSAGRPTFGRGSTYRRGKSVQTAGTTSLGLA